MSYKAALDAQLEPGVSLLAILDQTGDSTVQWSRGNEAEVAVARAAFDAARSRGMMAYRMTAAGNRGEVITAFDPNAEKIIVAPPLKGGNHASVVV